MEKQKNFCWGVAQLPDDEHGGNHANADKQPALPAVMAGQKGKRCPCVVGANQVEEAGDGAQSPYSKMFRIHCLVIWSTKISSAAQISQGQ